MGSFKKAFAVAFVAFALASMLVVDIEALPAPVTVNRTFYTDSYDGYIYRTHASYSSAWSSLFGTVDDDSYLLRVGQNYTGSQYSVYRGFPFRFDTSIIPDDAVLVNATLSLYVFMDNSTSDFNVTIQPDYAYGFSYPHVPLAIADYNQGVWNGTNNGTRSTSTISGTGYWNITASTTNFIHINDYTKFCVRSSEDVDESAPTGQEYVTFYCSERGEAYAPKLIVWYETDGYIYTVHAPYYENGDVGNCVINVTLQIANMPDQTYLFNGSDGVADTQEIQVEQRGIRFTWNISTPTYNHTRTYYLLESTMTEELWLLIPVPEIPAFLYSFYVTDFVGVTNAVLETIRNVDSNRIIERQQVDVVNSLPFWMQWATVYDMHLECDQGEHTWEFYASTDTTQSIVITAGMLGFDVDFANVTAVAVRENASYISTTYNDPESLTDWVNVTIQHRHEAGWVTDSTLNETTQGKTWYYNCEDGVDYIVLVSASKGGQTYSWSFAAPQPPPTTPVWSDISFLGSFPFLSHNLFGAFLVIMCGVIFSYRYLAIACFVSWIVAAWLVTMGWLQVSVPLLAISGFVVFITMIREARERGGM